MPSKPGRTGIRKDDLVAYLDGELDATSAQRVERILAKDGRARREVEMYARTWELLDELDGVRASEQFTQRTLSSLTDDAATRVTGATRGEGNLRLWVFALLTLVTATATATVTFRSASRPGPQRTERLLRDLSVIEDLHLYRHIPDVGFLHELHRSGVMEPTPSGSEDESDTTATAQ